jgi:Mlc titration factor MtfA (ptsG expression regulator)
VGGVLKLRWLSQLRAALSPEPTRIPDILWQTTLLQLPFLDRLDQDERARLKLLCERLLYRKPVSGASGFAISDEVAVLIAAQACLLVLNLDLALYDDLSAVLVLPDAFGVRQRHIDDAGVVHEWDEELAGEAVEQGGAVVLSWTDVALQQESGVTHNIVIHEFAHKIDMGRGAANGCPPFLNGMHDPALLRDWPEVFNAAYRDFCDRVDRFEAQLPEDFDDHHPDHAQRYDQLSAGLPLDPYAARDPAEFFAVASEAFFIAPAPLADGYPQIYRKLAAYYRQDPLASA